MLKVTPDEAVRMALENNLGVQADRLGPQIQTYGVAAGPRRIRAERSIAQTTTSSATRLPRTS